MCCSEVSPQTSSNSSRLMLFSIVDACVAGIQPQVDSCSTTDYSCLCNNYQNMLTCYNNCPGQDPLQSTVQQQVQQYCQDASLYGSTTTYGTAKSTHSVATTATAAGSAMSGFGSAAATSSSTSTPSNGAASVQVAGGALAVVAAGFGILL